MGAAAHCLQKELQAERGADNGLAWLGAWNVCEGEGSYLAAEAWEHSLETEESNWVLWARCTP